MLYPLRSIDTAAVRVTASHGRGESQSLHGRLLG
jgi:hypothetical protein